MLACLKRFKSDTDGSAALETVLWLPFFWLVLGFIIDATMLFQYQTRFMDVAREASRQVSIDNMTESEARLYIVNQFLELENVTARVRINGHSVTASVDAPISSLTLFSDIFTGDARVNGSMSMYREQAITQQAL